MAPNFRRLILLSWLLLGGVGEGHNIYEVREKARASDALIGAKKQNFSKRKKRRDKAKYG